MNKKYSDIDPLETKEWVDSLKSINKIVLSIFGCPGSPIKEKKLKVRPAKRGPIAINDRFKIFLKSLLLYNSDSLNNRVCNVLCCKTET